jgi:class 3 adenylate cyclase/tetratricopeptide (TPR) repeat protein
MTMIGDWLASIGLGEYADRFFANAIDVSVLGELTDQDLKDLEIPLGHRRKILREIANLSRSATEHAATIEIGDGAHRRYLTVIFCDLVGSTALSAELDPEDMRQVISAYQACIAEIVTRHSGMIARYMGDGVLIYFGYPQAHEDDAEQAVHTGLEVIEAIPKLTTGVNATLQVRVGIATGTVVVGDVITTETGVREQTVVGDPPNLAARLQTVAQPGTVVVCAKTRQLTDGYFNFCDLGSVALKGWSDPIHIWQALSSSGVQSRFEALHHHAKLMPLLGRDEEIELLARRWRDAKQGNGRAILLTGEPGIGKSHIALGFDELIRPEPHITLTYICSSHHINSSLFPYINQLERAAGFERSDAPLSKLTKLEFWLEKSTAHAEHQIALLANLLSLSSVSPYQIPTMSPQKKKDATFAVLLEQIEGLANHQPILIIFEDVHWIDPTSLELLALIVERLPQLPVLLLMTARPDFAAPWPRHAHVSTIVLTRLGHRDGTTLIERITGGKRLPDGILAQILARTDGVPLFVEELTKTVLESGQLRETGDQFVLQNSLPSLAIPTTLQASLMARLDRLAPVREVAQIGAVIGKEFSYELLSEVAGMPKNKLDDALGQLTQAELIFRRGVIPQSTYSFKHVLVRDAAYQGLLKSRRVQLHAALATALEQKFPEIVEAQPEIVAHHFMEAGLTNQAIKYWLQAGKKAALHSAHFEGIAHLQKALDALRLLTAGPERDLTELNLLMTIGPCLIATQGPAGSDTMAIFVRARELCEHLDDRPEYLQVMFWLTTACVVRGELPLAYETIVVLLDRAGMHGDRPALLNAMRGKAMILMFMGQIVEAGEMINGALEAFENSSEEDRLAARAAGQDAGVADLALKSWIQWIYGQPDAGAKSIEASVRRADSIGHPHTQAYAYYYASVFYALSDRFEIARTRAERCFELSEIHGFKQWHGLARTIIGICRALSDGPSTSIEDVKEALEEYRKAGYQLGITVLHVLLCYALLDCGRFEDAQEVADRGLATAESNSERVFEAELYRLKARALQYKKTSEASAEVDSLLEHALAIARKQSAHSLELRVARDLAGFWRDRGNRDKAHSILAPAYEWFTEGANTNDQKEAKALLDQL